jgi:hypothetical protein
MRDFSIKHKFYKYKTIFKFSQMPKSLVTAVSRSAVYALCMSIPIDSNYPFQSSIPYNRKPLFTLKIRKKSRKKFRFSSFCFHFYIQPNLSSFNFPQTQSDSNFKVSNFPLLYSVNFVKFQFSTNFGKLQFSA